jgi:YfiH family protein
VQICFTTRAGGVSQLPYQALNVGLHVGDAPQAVEENRQRLERGLPGAPLWLQQVHGVAVMHADIKTSALTDSDGVAPVADAAVTLRRQQVLAIMVADCLPVVLTNDTGTVLGVAHAGWRGLAAGVLEQTLAAMQRREPRASGWRAWVGPSIGPNAFEVGADVHAAFVAKDSGAAAHFTPTDRAAQKWLCDLPALAKRRLQHAGVLNVSLARRCTFSEPATFFSYRRDGPTGRMALLAWRE